MGTSQVPALISAVIATLTADPGMAGVQVIDGPLISAQQQATDWVCIGYDGDPEGEMEAASATQEWAGLGAKRKDEDISLICAVVSGRGDNNVAAARSRAYVLLGVVEDILRADPSLGFDPPSVFEMSAGVLYQELTTAGIQARIPFTVSGRTRI